MNLLEYEAKQLLANAKIRIPDAIVVRNSDELDFSVPCVVKSQVPVGGRGKAGGIVVSETLEDARAAATKIFDLAIKGHTPQSLLVEEKLSIARELYLSATINREQKSIELIASANGGMEVEDNSDESFLKLSVSDFSSDAGIDYDAIGDALADQFDLSEQTFVLQDMVEKLVGYMRENDATLIEINPLILTTADELIAGDCKMTLDDSAAFRHPDWSFETPEHDANFVTLDDSGNVATIANGAGLAMATVDAVKQTGLNPANFLDIGGGANEASVTKAFEKILEYNTIEAILINIFAGITRCDEVARAIVSAKQSFTDLPPLFIRLEGTNAAQARAILTENNIATYESLTAALQGLKVQLT